MEDETYTVTFVADYFVLTHTCFAGAEDEEKKIISQAGNFLRYQYGFDLVPLCSSIEVTRGT